MTNKRVHIFTKMLLFLIAFFISTSIVYHFTPTIQVHATDPTNGDGRYHSGQGTDGATTSMVLQGGPSYKKTCIGIYIAEKGDGEPASNVILISKDASIFYKSSEAYKIACKDESFQWSLNVGHFQEASLLEYPVKYVGGKFVPNGNETAKYLTTPVDGTPRWQLFAQECWSQDPVDNTTVYNKLMENPEDYVLIVVPIAWMNAYDNNKNMGNLIIATADGWAKYYRDKNMPNGCKYTNAMTHEGLPYSMTVSGTWFEGKLRGHDGERARKLSNDDILTEGYAMHIIELDGAIIHTYDELSEKRIRLNKTSEMSFFI